MLKLLKIIDKVEKPVMLNEAVSLNISANGDCPDDITSILGKLVNLSNPSTSTQDMTPHGGHKDAMMSTIANVDSYADQAAHDYADDMGEEYANEPNPEVSDVEYMTKDLAGGLNKPKKQFKKEYPGDNPMTMEEARAAELMLEYRKMTEQIEDEGIGSAAWALTKGAVKVPAKAVGNLAGGAAKGVLRGAGSLGKGIVKGAIKAAPAVVKGVGGAVGNVAMGAVRGIGKAGSGMSKDIKQVGRDVKTAYRKEDRMDELSPKTLGSYINKSAASLGKAGYNAGNTDGTAAKLDPHIHTINKRTTGIKRATDRLTGEATDPRDSLPQTYRPNDTTPYSRDRLATRMPSNPKDSKPKKAGRLLGLKSSIKDALGKHGPKGHLPEATDKKPTDDAKKKKSEKMKAYRADRDKNGED